jgi:hypothetical protein
MAPFWREKSIGFGPPQNKKKTQRRADDLENQDEI